MAHELTKGGKRRLTIDEFKELLDDDRVSQYGKINVRSAVSAIMDICPEDDNVWWVDARSIKCERARMIQKITFKID